MNSCILIRLINFVSHKLPYRISEVLGVCLMNAIVTYIRVQCSRIF